MTNYIMPYKETSKGFKYFEYYNDFIYLDPYLLSTINNEEDFVLNWGCGYIPTPKNWQDHWLNKPNCVALAVNKLDTFKKLYVANVRAPEWTTSRSVASKWDSEVVCRLDLEGKMGEGIEVREPNNLIGAALYTKHINHDEEFRVHVFYNDIINAGIKVPTSSKSNKLIRNYSIKEWLIDGTEPIDVPLDGRIQAIEAIKALGLHFGSVDIGMVGNKAYVFEVNTAPGSGHYTLTRFSETFQEYIKNEL